MTLDAAQLNPALLSAANSVPGKNIDMSRIDAAAQDFEAMFVSEMLRPMFNMLEVDETFGGGKGEEVFRSFLIEEYGKQVTASGGIGIAAQVKEQLIAMQSAASAAPLARYMHEKSEVSEGA